MDLGIYLINFLKKPFMAVCMFGGFLAFPQSQITFRQLSVKDGLSQNSAIAIAQDSTGYLWIATQDGLNKYDGRKFSTFPYGFMDITQPTYSNLGKVYADNQGRIWIIPLDKKTYKFNTNTATFSLLEGTDDASTIFQDRESNLWIGTFNHGLYVLKTGENIAQQVVPPSQLKGTIYNIAQRSDGTLLLAMDTKVVGVDPHGLVTTFKQPTTLYGDPITQNFSDIVIDNDEREWFSTFGDGLYYGEKGSDIFHRVSDLTFTDPLPLDLNITDLHLDSKDRLWIATYGRGLYMINFREGKINHFGVEPNNPKALHYNDILCIYEDYAETMWFGTDGAGISFYDEYLEKFNSLTNNQTPENTNIDVARALAVDNENAVWIGTSGKGLTQYEPATNSWRTFSTHNLHDNNLLSDRIMSLLVDDQNNLWIGTQGEGLSIRNAKGQINHYHQRSGIPLSAMTVWNIFKDKNGRFWLGSREHGLIQFDPNKGEIKKYLHDPANTTSIPGNNVRIITEDDHGNLWIGTEENGIASLNLESGVFTVYKNNAKPNSLSSDKIKSLYYAPNGILWIGTNGGGLNAFDIDNGLFNVYTVVDGLANNVIYGILPDEDGNLWLSSNKGITKFTPNKDLEKKPIIVNYANYDGLATEFNTGAYFKDAKGFLYFGGLDGFYWFRPDQLKENKIIPKTTITGLEIFNKPSTMTDNLVLNSNENTVSFTFSSLQFSLPAKNQYQYRLLNYDEEWVHAGNNNFARYAQLPPGNYDFQVKSSNYDGIWNETPVNFAFTIATPWYMNHFAKTIYILLLFLAILGIYRYLKWRWQFKLSQQLQQEEALRLKKRNAFKTKLYTDVAHEFRTPLTLISGPVEAKLSQGSLTDSDFASFSMIKRNTNRLISLVDQLLHLAKLETGKLNLKISQGDLGLFLGMLATSFEYRAKLKNMAYEIHVEPIGIAWYDEDALEKIVTNLLSNAFKYGLDGGICHLDASANEGYLHLEVKNSIEPTSDLDVKKLFTRFYQQDEYSEGAGVGLSLVKELVQLYQGEITVDITPGSIIHFRLKLPIETVRFSDQKTIEVVSEPHLPINVAIPDGIDIKTDTIEKRSSKELPILLIVEDHQEVRQFIKSVWKYKYKVLEAENGHEGIKKALEVVPDLIITDVRMPICDGITLCNRLKTDERTSHIPIILLTAGIGEEQELKGLQSGADDFITKPFKLKILQTRVENLIATRRRLRDRYSQEMVIKSKDIAITHTDELFLNRLQKILDKRLSDPEFNAEAFCREIGMSRMQLHRKLLAFTGLSTTAFIRSQRLTQALHILKTSDASINEVAYAVGFNTPSYFIKCFKEVFKKTPAEYLQSRN